MAAFKFIMVSSLLLVTCMINCCSGAGSSSDVGLEIHEIHNTYEYPSQPNYSTKIRELFPYLSQNGMETFVRNFSSFHSRHSRYYYGPDQAEGWLNQQIRLVVGFYTSGSISIQKVADPNDGDFRFYRSYKQESIIVKLEGHDPTLKNEVVILGAHYDSINAKLDKDRAPGADDNATGCAVLLEVLRLIAQFGIKLKHTVEFHWYAAEEPGLWGSQDVVKQFLKDKTKVKGMLNLDTLGYQSSEKEKGIKIFTDGTDPKLTAFVDMLIRDYLPGYRFITGTCFMCESDHVSWTENGYPAAFVAAADFSPHLHTSQDTIENVNFEQVREFAKLAVAFAIELGELVPMPVVMEFPAPIPDLTTESPKVTTGTSELTTDSSVMKPCNPSDSGKSVGVKLEEGWMKLIAFLIGMWLFY